MLQAMFLPHPTMADLRAGLGQTGALVYPDGLHTLPIQSIRDAAKRLRVDLPPTPKGLSDKEAALWESLCYMDIMAKRLEILYMAIARMLATAGSAPCDLVLGYNDLVYKILRIESDVLVAIRQAGIHGFPVTPPALPLFRSTDACKSGDMAPVRSDANPDGLDVEPFCQMPPAPGSGLSGPVVIIGATIVVAVLGYYTIKNITTTMVDVFKTRALIRQTELEAEFKMRQALKILELQKLCTDAGGDPVKCLEEARRAVPVTLDIAKKLAEEDRKKGEKGWLWWLGLVAVVGGLGAGGYAIYRRRNPRPLPRKA